MDRFNSTVKNILEGFRTVAPIGGVDALAVFKNKFGRNGNEGEYAHLKLLLDAGYVTYSGFGVDGVQLYQLTWSGYALSDSLR
ncbi:DUF2513 domain-containing protein [Pseudomonas chlororaphis]|uniref:hypothetical protein n=1 Tax=Pseudomonas TaxID=286 RepID=UPI0005BEC351|nr:MULTISPECIES: hypothetical protein [Pseudomonas]AJO76885.1 hypothetical protein TO66_06085 [Pseudomonas sp. MRSN 12121]MCB2254680.1 DUF2513 domain-containing protein [Pseudomonas chlororaphis]